MYLDYIFAFRGFNTEVAMRKAKENVEKHYAVVGVLEELNKTLTVLEHYVPRFFKGAKDVYYSEYINIQHSLLITIKCTIRNLQILTIVSQMRCKCSPRSTGTSTSHRWPR